MRCKSSIKNNLFRATALALLLIAFALALSQLTRDSLWTDEAWSVWVAGNPWSKMLWLVAADVHPPLYFIMLNRWMVVAGESVYATRLLSTFFALAGLAFTYPLGKRLIDSGSAIMAMLWLGSSSFFVYYAREVRMYTLIFALATLCMWAYLRWLDQRSARHSGLYLLSITALIYTHYAGSFLLISQFIYLCWVLWAQSNRRPKALFWHWIAIGCMAFILYIPWLPSLWHQIVANPDGPHTMAFPTNWANTRWLFLVISGGSGLWLLLPLLFSRQIIDGLKQAGRWKLELLAESPAPLFILWVMVTPLTMLAINSWVAPFYAVRYVIGILAGAALLVAYILRQVKWRPLRIGFLACFVYINLTSVGHLLPPKTPWENIMQQVLMERQPDEPSLVKIVEPGSMEAYYDRQLGMLDGQTLNLSHSRQDFAEVETLISELSDSPTVWVMMPSNVPETWTTLATLANERPVGYRHHADYMLFYRFESLTDTKDHETLGFQFKDVYHGDQLRYQEPLFASRPNITPGENICFELTLQALNALEDRYSYGVHLVDMANQLMAQHDQRLGSHAAHDMISLNPCLALSSEVPNGEYYVHLVLYRWHDGQRMRVLENGADWGDALLFEMVQVED